MLTFEDFKKLELKTAKIVDVKDHPNADKLYVITIDVGGEKKDIVAGIKSFYTPEELKGRNVVIANNIEPAIIRGVESKAMLLAASCADGLSIVTLDRDMPSGSTVK
ncbi:MAG: hypothetical protein V2A72_03005 [Candidatus Omnitrophota bacterium]